MTSGVQYFSVSHHYFAIKTDGAVPQRYVEVTSRCPAAAGLVVGAQGEKKIAFKMKRRKGYHKTIGHRQELTVVQIREIKL